MAHTDLEAALAAALTDRQLLEHPFYQRWQAGELETTELARYAEQYRHVEASLPETLAGIAGALEPGTARDLVSANLSDELSEPRAHVELFEGFADAFGAGGSVAATPATAALIAIYRDAVAKSPIAGLGVLASYECQAAAIASSKADGLREHYGAGPEATEFWDVHATMEADHASWTLEAITSLAGSSPDDEDTAELASDGMQLGAAAWWEWLSEREAEHAAA